MAEFTTEFVTGEIWWCKALGNPVDNYDGDAKEWTLDFVPDDTEFLKKHRLLDRLKEDKSGNMPDDYIRIRKPELNKDGEKNKPMRFYDADDFAWDTDTLIGNGTKALLKLTIADWGKGKKKSIWLDAARITDHVPYEGRAGGLFGDYDNPGGDEDEAPKKAAKKPAPKAKTKPEVVEDLDDDIPF
jgi:hypothetical protein